MHKSTKILLTVFLTLIIGIGVFFALYSSSALPEVKGDYNPHEKQKIAYNAPLKIEFTNKMNQKITESAFKISPEIKGNLSWEDGYTLVFTPHDKFKIGENISITIAKSAQDYLGKNLIDEYRRDYTVIGALQVIFVSPANEFELAQIKGEKTNEDMNKEPIVLPYSPSPYAEDQKIPKITVMFDRPIREMTTLDESDINQPVDFLEIEPEIRGEYKWLGASAIQFIPEKLPMSTKFEISIPKGTQVQDAGVTEEEYVWHFETEGPRLIKSTPLHGELFFDPKEEVKLHFNQHVNIDTLYQMLNFYPPEDGFFNGEITFERDDLTTVIIKPKPKLVSPENYTLSIQKGVRGFNGTKESEEEILIKFKTYDKAEIVRSAPQDGAENVKLGNPILTFATPMDDESLKEHLKITPEIPNMNIWSYDFENHVNTEIIGDFESGQTYSIELKKGSKDKFGQIIRKDFKITFTTADAAPNFNLMSQGRKGFFSKNLSYEYYLNSININNVDLELCELAEEDYFKWERSNDWNDYNCEDGEKWSLKINSIKNQHQTTSIPLEDKIQDNGIYFISVSSEEFQEDENEHGYPIDFKKQVFFVSDTALSLKYSEDDILVWANDMISGEPVENMNIFVKDTVTGNIIKSGVTNADGLFTESIVSSDQRFYVFAEKNGQWGIVGSNWSQGINSWDLDLQRDWHENERIFGYIFTERPIYRPDQEVYFKGLIRHENDVNFSIPTEKNVEVKITDAFGKVIYDESVELNTNGSFSGNFQLKNNSSVGHYSLTAKYLKSSFWQEFQVEEYRKPEFLVEIESKSNSFINKQHLVSKILGSYYFGGNLPNAPVSWSITTDNFYFDAYEDEWFNFSNTDYYDRNCGWWDDCDNDLDLVDSGEGELNHKGEFEIDIPLNIEKKSMSQLYTVSVTVNNANNQQVTQRKTFVIHKGDYYVGIKSSKYVGKVNDKTEFKIITVDHEGSVLKDKSVNVDFYKREWDSVRKEGTDGEYKWETETKDTLISSEKVSTDENGKSIVAFTPKAGGYYIAKARSLDEKNNEIMAQASVYVSSSSYIGWGSQNNSRIDLVLDKTSYSPGDTANILVKSPFEEDVKALLTIERQGIMSSKILDLKNNSEIIKLPITEEMLPNVYVSVLLFKGSGTAYQVIKLQKEIYETQTLINKNEAEKKELEEEIELVEEEISEIEEQAVSHELRAISEEIPLEGDEGGVDFDEETENIEDSENTVRFKIKTQKLKNSQEELEKLEQEYVELVAEEEVKKTELAKIKKEMDVDTLAKIEAEQFSEYPRPEFKLGYANILVNTESKRLSLKMETDKERYHAGDTVKLKVKTTNIEGKGVPAEVSIAVVDEAILALKSRNLEDLVDYFYAKRGLKVDNSQSLVYFIDRLSVKSNMDIVQDLGGGGGGGDGEDVFLKTQKRDKFKDTAFWEPSLQTDANGEAEISFTLPDNLTTWQILAIGATKDTIVGSGENDFMTTEDLIVRPVLTRFLVMNDVVNVEAIVHNNTGDSENIRVTLSGENFVIEGDGEQKVTIADREEAKITWEVRINQGNPKDFLAKFNFKAETDLHVDEVEKTLPIKSFSIPEVVSTSGMTSDLARENIYLPKSVEPEMGEVKINIAPTLATNLKDGLEFLANFTYECTEQTISRHLSNVVLKQLKIPLEGAAAQIPLEGDKGGVKPQGKQTHESNQSTNASQENLDEMVSQNLQKLYQLQRHDGGWGYWTNSDFSYPYLSAYVLFGLSETQKAGYSVDQKIIEKGKIYLTHYLNTPEKHTRYNRKINLDDQAFALWVLSKVDGGELSLSLKLMDDADELSLFAKGYLMMSFMELSRTQESKAIQKILNQKVGILKSEIENKAIVDARGTHFEEAKQNYWSMNSNTRTTAILLKTLVQNDVENPLIPKIIEWLNAQKKDGHWSSTQETTWSLLAFADFFHKSGELNANYNVKVNLNDTEALNTTFNAENLFTREELITQIKDLRIGTPSNEILFNKEGEGNLYYDITAKYYLPAEEIKERSEGFSLIRNYSNLDDEDETEVRNPQVGDILKGKLTLVAPDDRHFVLMEEFLPAGFEAINFNLETENQNLQLELNNVSPFYHREFRDDRISLFADYLPAGVYEFEFLVRVTSAGQFHHLPAQTHEMYFPENFGRTRGRVLEIGK